MHNSIIKNKLANVKKYLVAILTMLLLVCVSLGASLLMPTNQASAATTIAVPQDQVTFTHTNTSISGVTDIVTSGGVAAGVEKRAISTSFTETLDTNVNYWVSANVTAWSSWTENEGRIGFYVYYVDASNFLRVYLVQNSGSLATSKVVAEHYVNGTTTWGADFTGTSVITSALQTTKLPIQLHFYYSSGYKVSLYTNGYLRTTFSVGSSVGSTGVAKPGVYAVNRDITFGNFSYYTGGGAYNNLNSATSGYLIDAYSNGEVGWGEMVGSNAGYFVGRSDAENTNFLYNMGTSNSVKNYTAAANFRLKATGDFVSGTYISLVTRGKPNHSQATNTTVGTGNKYQVEMRFSATNQANVKLTQYIGGTYTTWYDANVTLTTPLSNSYTTLQATVVGGIFTAYWGGQRIINGAGTNASKDTDAVSPQSSNYISSGYVGVCTAFAYMQVSNIKLAAKDIHALDVYYDGAKATTVPTVTVACSGATNISNTSLDWNATRGSCIIGGTTQLTVTLTVPTNYRISTTNNPTTATSNTLTLTTSTSVSFSTSLYVWQIYTITYNKNNATSIGATSQTVAHGVSYTAPSITRSNWTVLGWNTSSSAITSEFNVGATNTATANATYYAITSATLTINYKRVSGDSVTTASHNATTYNTNGTLATLSMTVSGWTNVGWATANNTTTKTYSVNQSLTISQNQTITLYGIVSRTVTLSYNGNGNTGGSTASQTATQYRTVATENGSVTFTTRANGFTKTGYTFTNWNTLSDGTGTTVKANDTYTVLSPTSAAISLYAIWQINTYTLTINYITQTVINGHETSVSLSATPSGGTLSANTIAVGGSATYSHTYQTGEITFTFEVENETYKYYISTSATPSITQQLRSTTFNWAPTPTANTSVSIYVWEVLDISYGNSSQGSETTTVGATLPYDPAGVDISPLLTSAKFEECVGADTNKLFWDVDGNFAAIDVDEYLVTKEVVIEPVSLSFNAQSNSIGLRINEKTLSGSSTKQNGLRFVFGLTESEQSYLYDLSRGKASGYSVEVKEYIMVVATDQLGANELTTETYNDSSITVKTSTLNYNSNSWLNGTESYVRNYADAYEFAATIINMQSYYYTRSFTARAYSVITINKGGQTTTFTTYSDAQATSLYDRAVSAIAIESGEYTDAKLAVLERYVDRVIKLDANNNTVAITNYTPWYNVSTSGNVITITAKSGETMSPDGIYLLYINGKKVLQQNNNGELVYNPSLATSLEITETTLTLTTE